MYIHMYVYIYICMNVYGRWKLILFFDIRKKRDMFYLAYIIFNRTLLLKNFVCHEAFLDFILKINKQEC